MTDIAAKPKVKPELGAEKLTAEEQRRRFELLAQEAGCDGTSDACLDRAIAVLGRQKPKD